MSFQKKSNNKNDKNSTVNKVDTLAGLQLVCAYLDRNIQNDPLFQPEYTVAKAINSLIEQRDILNRSDVIEALNLLNDIENVDHYDGTGWLDYKIRLANFLKLNGFITKTKGRRLELT